MRQTTTESTTESAAAARHVADGHDIIRVLGARENDLAGIDLELPKRRLTVFTGVSGSGKSSLVLATIAAESQRLINETYSAFVQGFMPTAARPDVDVIEGLTTAIVVDQERLGGDARSTVGTVTDANALLRILFSRLGEPHVGPPGAFSFNVPSVRASGSITVERGAGKRERVTFTRAGGMCPRCEGRGTVSDFDVTALYDDSKSLNEGAVTVPGYSMEGWYGRIFRGCGFFDPDKPIRTFTEQELDDLLHREPTRIEVDGVNLTYAGLIPTIKRSMLSKDVDAMQPHDVRRMNDLLLRLRDKGNTVLVVEHEPETISIADHVVDLGPGAGAEGGTVCFEGTVAGLRASGTLTGRHLDDRASLKQAVRTSTGALELRGARMHNLRNVDVDIPLGVLVVVTGVAGAGKSSLVRSIPGHAGVVRVDQAPIRGSRRSNPATYTGLLDPIRKAFARANGVKPALFSANSEGACPACNGAGVVYTDLAMMAAVAVPCEECDGRRFQPSVLEHRLAGRDISEVLAMSVTEARAFLGAGEARSPAALAVLGRLADVGLGYLGLGQPLTTLSGGERQRLKLATHLGDEGGVYLLDEPTTGLHPADVEHLLGLLDRLVDTGRSVVVVEHHQSVVAHADWIVDLGPGAGHDGGQVVFSGTPADLVAARSTVTGRHLAAYVA